MYKMSHRSLLSIIVLFVVVCVSTFQAVGQEEESEETKSPSEERQPETAGEYEQEIDNLISDRLFQEAQVLIEKALDVYDDHEGILASQTILEILLSTTEPPFDPANNTAEDWEMEIDPLIEGGDLTRAEIYLEIALNEFPDHEGLQSSQDWLELEQMLREGAQLDWAEYFDDPVLRWTGIIVLILLLGVPVCLALTVWFFLLRGRPYKAAGVYIFLVFGISVPIAVTLGSVLLATFDVQKQVLISDWGRHMFYLALSCFLGGVGGALDSSYILANRHKYTMPPEGEFTFFFFRPINGLFLAAVMYFALVSGQLALFSQENSNSGVMPSPWAVCLLAVLTGIFSQGAVQKLRQISQTIFGHADILEIDRRRTQKRRAESEIVSPDIDTEV